MGWNEARVDVVPDGWQLTIEETDAMSVSGENVKVTGTERIPGISAEVLWGSKLERWLAEVGFVLSEKWVSGATYVRGDILVEALQEEDEVKSILLQFTLDRDSPRRWNEWQQFVDALCARWPVALGDAQLRMRVGPEHLFSVLRRTTAWREFEEAFHWPSPIA